MPENLFVDADSDQVTKYCCAFRTAIVLKMLPPASYDHLLGRDAVQWDVNSAITNNNYSYISGAGHGLYRMFLGYQDTVIWRVGDDLSHLQGTIVHLLSCQTGSSLGRSMIKQGVRAFWGYAEDFAFFQKKFPPANLLSDQTAEHLLKMDCLIDLGILQGKTADLVYHMVDDYVANLVSSLPQRVRDALVSNYQNLVCPLTTWGDPDATV